MSASVPSSGAAWSPSVAVRVDAVCVRFEAAWRAAGPTHPAPRIEDYLGAESDVEYPVLLEELLALELAYRVKLGETPLLDEYKARFPGRDTVIQTAWACALAGRHTDDSPTGREGTGTTPGCAGRHLPTVAGYEVLSELGRGGMGVVYLAEDEVLRRRVAVKILPPSLTGQPRAARRFLEEARLLARLPPHPNVAIAFQAGEHDGLFYLVMELVPGTDLGALVEQSGRLPVGRACELVRQVAAGLAHAHLFGVVHRDIKPANLMLTPNGTVKILDLGLARLMLPESAGTEPALTATGTVLGTPDFMSPEQVQDAHAADGRSDLYSLGCTFYYLLVGRPPFADNRGLHKLAAHASDEPTPIEQLRPDVPPTVAAVLHRLLAKRPEERYSSAPALIEALDAASSDSPRARPRTPARGRSLRWWGAVAALLVLVGVSAVLLGPDRQDQPLTLPDLELLIQRQDKQGQAAAARLPFHAVLVRVGVPQPLAPYAPLRDNDGFRLYGSLNRPAYWYVVWCDTAGEVVVEEDSGEARVAVEYPRNGEAVSVNPKNPPGVHLILLVAGTVPPSQGKDLLQQALRDLGKPPQVLPDSWARPLRGAGARLPADAPMPSEYLRTARERLPPGLEDLHAIFIKTEK